MMDDKARLQLQNMISANNVQDQTELIRNLKHSVILKDNITNLLLLKQKYKNGEKESELHLEAMNECSFLFTYYTDLYNKIRKDEIDINILFNFLEILKKIEDGELDQHEGSFQVGTILKKIYVDSALRKAAKLDKEHAESIIEDKIETLPPKSIQWKDFKRLML